MQASRAVLPLMLPALILLLLFFVYPVAEIVRLSLFDDGLRFDHFWRFFSTAVYIRVFTNKVLTSLIVAVGTLAIGYPVAYHLAHVSDRVRPLLLYLILIPLWLSVLIRTYAWMVLLGRNGVVNSAAQKLGLIDEPMKLLFVSEAVYAAMMQILLPIMVLACYSAMTTIDQRLVTAARLLGASPYKAFFWIFLPLSLGGAMAGFVMVFMLSMGFFITPALLGGRKDMMMSNLIDFQVNQSLNWGFASAIAVVLMLATVTMVLVLQRIARNRGAWGA